MIITVKAKHIRLGKPGCDSECPIALAIEEAISEAKPSVGYLTTHVFYNGSRKIIPNTGSVNKFISKIDNDGRKAVKPFSFRLQVPR